MRPALATTVPSDRPVLLVTGTLRMTTIGSSVECLWEAGDNKDV